MNTRLLVAATILLSLGARAPAHRLDEYLQATLISVENDRVQVSIRLIPVSRFLPSCLRASIPMATA